MPRQPFLPNHSKFHLIYGPGQVKKKPKMTEAIGRCIMTFSYVDWQMAVLLAAIMKTNTDASVAVFLTLKNARARREVLIAAADTTLPDGPDREIFDALILLYASLQSQRADLAHGVFGHIPEGSADEIPWIEARNLSKAWIEKFHLPKPPEPELTPEPPESELDHKRHSFIYKVSDLEKLDQDINDLWLSAFVFTGYLVDPTELNSKLLRSQCSEPQMAQALSRIRNPKNNSKPQK